MDLTIIIFYIFQAAFQLILLPFRMHDINNLKTLDVMMLLGYLLFVILDII
jgi:hypothetical protein